MPISSPEDHSLPQRKSSHSPSPHRGMVMMKKQHTGSPGSMEKYGTPPSTSSLDNEGLEDVSMHGSFKKRNPLSFIT